MTRTSLKRLSQAAAVLALGLPSAAFAADVLSAAQIEKAIGIKGLKAQPTEPGKPSLTFVNAKMEPIVNVKVEAESVYEVWKSQAGADAQPLAGIGRDAFLSNVGFAFACFKTSGKAVCVVPGFSVSAGGPTLTQAQVIALARAAAANR